MTGTIRSGQTTAAARESHRRIAESASLVAQLPAVATLDWCDAAASALVHLSKGSLALLLVAQVEPDGRVSNHEAGGSAYAGDATSVRLRHVVSGLRASADHLRELGWKPSADLFSRGQLGAASSIAGPGWRDGMIGQVWQASDVTNVIAAAYPLAPSAESPQATGPTRCLIVHLGISEDAGPLETEASQLAAVLPQLAARVVLALGTDTGSGGRWLTGREQQVLEELTLGKSVREIADILGRSPHTVHDHVKSLHRKLGASSRGELIARALGHLGTEIDLPTEPMAIVTGAPAAFEPKPSTLIGRATPISQQSE